jgi:hypothetical protein
VWRRERREYAGRPVARSVPYTHTHTLTHSNADTDTHTQSNPNAVPDPDAHSLADADAGSQRVAWPVPATLLRQSPGVPAAAARPGVVCE